MYENFLSARRGRAAETNLYKRTFWPKRICGLKKPGDAS